MLFASVGSVGGVIAIIIFVLAGVLSLSTGKNQFRR